MNQANINLYSNLKAKKDATPKELKVIAAFDIAKSAEEVHGQFREPALTKAYKELAEAEKALGSEQAIPVQKNVEEAVPDSGHFGGSGNVPTT